MQGMISTLGFLRRVFWRGSDFFDFDEYRNQSQDENANPDPIRRVFSEHLNLLSEHLFEWVASQRDHVMTVSTHDVHGSVRTRLGIERPHLPLTLRAHVCDRAWFLFGLCVGHSSSSCRCASVHNTTYFCVRVNKRCVVQYPT